MAVRRDDNQAGEPGGGSPRGTPDPAGPTLSSMSSSDVESTVRHSPPSDGARARDPADRAGSNDTDAWRASTPDSGGEERAGVDARRRGWFWHWNSIVTQYAPLIGLKGVGLLNSYTVWTDRRDESPHRGYAFPSQQSEADFYGEERSELITINKVLVALDLIEIRKEMILRADERGRRWRVPHNLYRVKDRPEGALLRADDVLRVTSLARDDAAVYRYVRRIFSPRFKPIDRDNAWHAILTELADHPLWVEMRQRAAEQESRASDRSRRGHRTRAARDTDASAAEMTDGQLLPSLSDENEHDRLGHEAGQTSVAAVNNGSPANPEDVARTSSGSSITVAVANDGSGTGAPTSGAGSNTGRPSSVAPSNATYHQHPTTTTTTTSSATPSELPKPAVAAQPAVTPDEPTGNEPVDLARTSAGNEAPEAADTVSVTGTAGQANTPDRVTGHHAQAPPDMSQGLDSFPPAAPGPAGAAGLATGRARPSGDGEERWGEAGNAEGHEGGLDGESGLRGSDEGSDAADDGDAVGVAHLALGPKALAPDYGRAGSPAGAGDGIGRVADAGGGGPLGDPSPLVVSLFEAANDRRSSPLERILLAELERDADPAARAAGSSGAEWVAEALREAVASGSTFVAPKRVREIIIRWSRESAGPEGLATDSSRRSVIRRSPEQAGAESPAEATALDALEDVSGRRSGSVRLPGGADGRVIWDQTLNDLSRVLDRAAFDRLLGGSSITRFRKGVVEIRVQTAAAADKLSAEYRALVERHVNARLPRPITVAFLTEPTPLEQAGVSDEGGVALAETGTLVISRQDFDLASRVWQAIRDDLASALPRRDLDGLGAVVPLGEDAGGVMLLGVSSSRSLRLVDGRCRADIERAMSALLGRAVTVRAIPSTAWSVALPE